ncbi:MAG: NAD(P)H-dependent oxidoreductase [Ilumatobacteraceae bacterium]
MRVLVVHCHPDPTSLVSAAHQRVLIGLARAGHEVRVRDLYAEGFDPLFDADDHRRHLEPGPAPGLESHVDDLRWCDTIVFVYPTWWSGQPAMLKGWIDRVWVRGVAWELRDGADRLRPLLRNVRRLVVVTTHGSSKLVNALEGESGKRTVTRSLRLMCHPRCRTSWWALYGIDTAPASKRTGFLDRVEARAAAL